MQEYTEHLKSPVGLYGLYRRLGWADFLQLDAVQLVQAMAGSWYVLYVYDQDRLIGTGRVVSDGVINAYLCGLGVDPEYRNQDTSTRSPVEVATIIAGNVLGVAREMQDG